MRRHVIRRGLFAEAILTAEAILCRLPAGRPPLQTARRRHWPRDAEYEKVICPGAGVYLKIEIGFILQNCLELPVVCTPNCQRRSILRPPNNGRKTLNCYKVMIQVALLRHCDIMWQYMGAKFSLSAAHLVYKAEPCIRSDKTRFFHGIIHKTAQGVVYSNCQLIYK